MEWLVQYAVLMLKNDDVMKSLKYRIYWVSVCDSINLCCYLCGLDAILL